MPTHENDLMTAAGIAETVAMTDPVVRNLRITHTYWLLAVAIGKVVGAENTNWCNFATWASKQAGATIRGDTMPSAIHDLMTGNAHFKIQWRGLIGTLNEITEDTLIENKSLRTNVLSVANHVSDHIARGNLKVFAELAPVFLDFVTTFGADTSLDRAKLKAFVGKFRPGPSDQDGQDNLVDAFTALLEAKFETNPKTKAELMLLANNLTGLHEQTRLQDRIEGALSTPIEDVIGILGRTLGHDIKFSYQHKVVDKLEGSGIAKDFIELFHHEATKHMMRLWTPDEDLDLGQDVPSRADHPMFPETLTDISNTHLKEVLSQYDRTADSTRGSGAKDWVELTDRMNYIVDLFRSRQTTPTLFNRPFTEPQVGVFLKGDVPDAPL